jgi:hypothetical protein
MSTTFDVWISQVITGSEPMTVTHRECGTTFNLTNQQLLAAGELRCSKCGTRAATHLQIVAAVRRQLRALSDRAGDSNLDHEARAALRHQAAGVRQAMSYLLAV